MNQLEKQRAVRTNIEKEMMMIRRQLHQIPELAMTEHKTFAYIKEKLSNTSFQLEEVLGTGILAYKRGSIGERTIGFRADMDGLPIMEKNKVDYRSGHDNRMHACGHDGHMAMLLGLAMLLEEAPPADNVLLLFQPAEEDIGGAESIVDSGILDRYRPECIVAIHLMPDIPEGIAGLCNGPIMAQATEIDLTIRGRAAHCAKPQEGIDAILIAAELVRDYEYILSKSISPMDQAVINIGSFHGGQARNILCDEVKMKGTLRTFSEDTCQVIKQAMQALHQGVEKKYGGQVDCHLKDIYPPVVNDDNLHQLLARILAPEEYQYIHPLMTSDDFSYYGRVCPIYYIFLGTQSEQYHQPLHNEYFNFDEKVLAKGLDIYRRILESFKLEDEGIKNP